MLILNVFDSLGPGDSTTLIYKNELHYVIDYLKVSLTQFQGNQWDRIKTDLKHAILPGEKCQILFRVSFPSTITWILKGYLHMSDDSLLSIVTDASKIEVEIKSDVNTETTILPNNDVFEKYGNQLLDTQVGQTDMKVRHIFKKFVEVWLLNVVIILIVMGKMWNKHITRIVYFLGCKQLHGQVWWWYPLHSELQSTWDFPARDIVYEYVSLNKFMVIL